MAKAALNTTTAPTAIASVAELIDAHRASCSKPSPAEEIAAIMLCARSWDDDVSDEDGALAADYIASFDGTTADEYRLPFIDSMSPCALRVIRTALEAASTHTAYEAGYLMAAE